MRLPFFRRQDAIEVDGRGVPVVTDHPGPQPAFRILGQSPEGNPDPFDWFRAEPYESVKVIGPDDRVRRTAPPPAAGYRWASSAAQAPCDAPEPAERETVAEIVPAGPTTPAAGGLPAVRYERAMVALAARTEILAGAIGRIESRIDSLAEQLYDAASQTDIVEVESRRASLAAEVSRLAVELRGELDRRVTELARAMARGTERTVSVNHLGPLDLADARRFEIQLDRVVAGTGVGDLTSVSDVSDLTERRTA
ncbi:MAG TPA: hypothetical protein VM618_11410 [Acidimicrobiia bacterium]|nr:hypothetical protein [Acidimicrobiia bacterium]